MKECNCFFCKHWKGIKIAFCIIVILALLTEAIFIFIMTRENKETPIYEYPMLKQKVCYMPEECFKTYEGFTNQFPEKEIPEYYPECLVYCYKRGLD